MKNISSAKNFHFSNPPPEKKMALKVAKMEISWLSLGPARSLIPSVLSPEVGSAVPKR